MVTELDLLLLKVSLDHFLPIENFGYSYFIFQNFTKQKNTRIQYFFLNYQLICTFLCTLIPIVS